VSTTEELLGRKSRGSGLESREYGRGDSLELTLPTGGARSVGIVGSRTGATEFVCFVFGNIVKVSVR
jgi:hypothetical protein